MNDEIAQLPSVGSVDVSNDSNLTGNKETLEAPSGDSKEDGGVLNTELVKTEKIHEPSPHQLSRIVKENPAIKDELNKIVNAEKRKAAEQERLRLYSELNNQNADRQKYNTAAVQQQDTKDDVLRVSDFYRLQQEQQELYRQQQVNAEGNAIAESFLKKIEMAKLENPDLQVKFDELDGIHLDMRAIYHLNKVDNLADVLDEFYKNPTKMYAIEELAKRNPSMAHKKLQELSASIKKNKEAAARTSPNAPIDQVSPSIAPKDNGRKSVIDLYNAPQCQW